MTANNHYNIVSMLIKDSGLTLFDAAGAVININSNGPYNITKLNEDLLGKLTGTNTVELDLEDYIITKSVLNVDELLSAGIEMSHTINGETVQGFFYPRASIVSVLVGTDRVEIPHVENLHAHMIRAAADQSPSVINFFKRIAPVIQARKHSGEDLMKFIKHSDLPLTNTGRIIAYKRVNKYDEHGYYVDIHSGKIKQRVGSRVRMPVDMVDDSRHNSCSTGLHVANLGYMAGFSGSHTLIVLVDPEDFIAVPAGEDTKARVCAYDIIGVVSGATHKLVSQSNHADGDVTFEALISSAVMGTAIEPFEEIMVGTKEITSVTPLIPSTTEKTVEVETTEKPTKTQTAKGSSLKADASNKETIENVKRARAIKTANANDIPDNVLKAFYMLMAGETQAKTAEKSNTSSRTVGRWMEKYNYPAFVESSMKSKREVTPKTTTTEKPSEPAKNDTGTLTVQQQAGMLYKKWAEVNSVQNYDALVDFKRSKKKSWDALGFDSNEIQAIVSFKG